MIMFRTDTAGDGGLGGGVGGSSMRKAHPIFKGAKTSDGGTTDGASGGGWSLFMCSISLNDSDPRFRPPICSTLVGVTVMAMGAAALALRDYSIALTAGLVIIPIGAFILLFSFIWLIVTRQKIVKNLKMKAAGTDIENADSKPNSKNPRNYPLDPIMTRGLVTIYYKSCEDTLPYGTGRLPLGTKAVRVPPTDGFMPVESSCFQLIAAKGDAKYPNRSHSNARTTTTTGSSSADKRTGKGRTLPARPNLEKTSGTLKNGTRDKKIVRQHKSDSDAHQQERSTLVPTLSDPSRMPQGRHGFVGDRSKTERQPMLNPHSNVYKTDFQPNRRPK